MRRASDRMHRNAAVFPAGRGRTIERRPRCRLHARFGYFDAGFRSPFSLDTELQLERKDREAVARSQYLRSTRSELGLVDESAERTAEIFKHVIAFTRDDACVLFADGLGRQDDIAVRIAAEGHLRFAKRA